MELQIRKLSKTYSNGVEALKEITLTIPQGMDDGEVIMGDVARAESFLPDGAVGETGHPQRRGPRFLTFPDDQVRPERLDDGVDGLPGREVVNADDVRGSGEFVLPKGANGSQVHLARLGEVCQILVPVNPQPACVDASDGRFRC